jgi:Na+/proline symporter
VNGLLLSLLAYLAAQVVIGAWVSRGIHSESDFLVAGRRLGYPLTIFTVFATWFGAETVLASAGRVHQQGFAFTTAEPIAYGLCLIAAGAVFAAPLWRRGLTTPADLFRQRYSPGVERLAALVMIPSSLLWAGAQLRGFAHVLTTVTALDLAAAIGVAAGFCVAYTMLGGLMADAITDLVQGIVLILGLATLAVGVVLKLGGPAGAIAAFDPARVSLAGRTPGEAATALAVLEEWAVPICGSVVAAELVSRLIAARSPVVARRGSVIAGALYVVVGLVPVALGLTAARLVGVLDDPEQFLPVLARATLPAWGYVLFAGALVSAILSTVNTILLVTGGIAAHNLVAPALGITDDRQRLRLSRAGVVVFGVVAWALALGSQGIGVLVELASAFGSAGVLVVVCFALFSRRGGPLAAGATLLGGLLVYLAAALGGAPYPYLTSLAAALLCYAAGAAVEAARDRNAAAVRADA